MNEILYNAIQTPDGAVLVSRSVHDYVTHTDKNGLMYSNDGGTSYMHRTLQKTAPYKELSLYTDSPHEQLREKVTWGTRGKTGANPLTYKPIKDLADDHITAILDTQSHIPEKLRDVFLNELQWRGL